MMRQKKKAKRYESRKLSGRLCRMLVMTLLAALLTACTSKAEPDENSGLYEAVSVKAFGFEMAVDEIFDEAVTIELKDGGKAVFTYEGKSYNMKWSRSGSDFEASGGGAELSGTVKDGVMELTDILDSGVDITLECKDILRRGSKGNDDETEWATDDGMDMFVTVGYDTEAGTSAQTLSDEQMELIRLYEGDWYGMLRINHAYDGYSEYADLETLVTARFSFDDTGSASAWLCANLTPAPSNFQNVTAEVFPTGDRLLIRFDFMEGSTQDDVYLRVDKGLLTGAADIENNAGDEMDLTLALRKVGDKWTEDDEFYWNHAASYAHLSEGMTAEELAQAWIGDQYPKPVPVASNISEENSTASAQGGSAQSGTSGIAGTDASEPASGKADTPGGTTASDTGDKYIYEGKDLNAGTENIVPSNYSYVPYDRFEEGFKALVDGTISTSSTYEDVAKAFGDDGVRIAGMAYEGYAYYAWYADKDYTASMKTNVLVTFKVSGGKVAYYAYSANGINAKDVE